MWHANLIYPKGQDPNSQSPAGCEVLGLYYTCYIRTDKHTLFVFWRIFIPVKIDQAPWNKNPIQNITESHNTGFNHHSTDNRHVLMSYGVH